MNDETQKTEIVKVELLSETRDAAAHIAEKTISILQNPRETREFREALDWLDRLEQRVTYVVGKVTLRIEIVTDK